MNVCVKSKDGMRQKIYTHRRGPLKDLLIRSTPEYVLKFFYSPDSPKYQQIKINTLIVSKLVPALSRATSIGLPRKLN